ncbi:metallophosphoesterase [Siccirubricoccus sp. KC 17139]|uniref:Metallophosphoesterase n=1 Tax=Siccirubricoccus soli TaxID=2899147 RepID=A0ABT1D7B8_9PROT|nr:metallophosphoesterase [Siccirubricoccus soli]MCP2683280.1 metallophosphoesterase [Siccirubricoccus soli]
MERGLARLDRPPEDVVLLGDMECHAPLDTLVAPILAAGARLHWIHGNHDADGGPGMWANLADPALNPITAAGALHGRVARIGGLRVAGLGGTFRARVWLPPAPPRLQARAELDDDITSLGPEWREDARATLRASLATLAIWPEDVAALAAQRADILVTHEAPSSHPAGLTVIEALARDMGARLIVHGHHHIGYRARAADGLEVQGVGAAWGIDRHGVTHWAGEAERWLGRKPAGWEFAD